MIQDSLKQWQAVYEQMWDTFASSYEDGPRTTWTWYPAGAADGPFGLPTLDVHTNLLDIYVDHLQRAHELFWSPYSAFTGGTLEDLMEYQQHWWNWWLKGAAIEDQPKPASGRAKAQRTVGKSDKPAVPVAEQIEIGVEPRTAANDQPGTQTKDDLKQISGIGPGLEKKLNDKGIYTFGQIASLRKDQIAKLEAEVVRFPGRIRRDNWVGQAKRLSQS